MAFAQSWTGAVGCNRLDSVDRLIEVGLQGSHNEFGSLDQEIVGISGSYADCISKRTRLRLEAAFSEVIEEGRHARAILAGVAVQTELSPNLSATPFVHIGVETSRGSGGRLLLNGGVAVEAAFPLNAAAEGLALNLTLRPEYTDRRVGSDLFPGRARYDGTFHNTASAAIDFAAGSRFRSKVGLVHQLIDGGQPTSSIGSVVLSLRKLRASRSAYRWNADLWLSRGNGDFSRVLVAFSYRFESGLAVRRSRSNR